MLAFLLGLCVAFCGALLLAAGSELQSGAVYTNDGRWARFIRSPRWLLGLALLATAVSTNFIALALAPVSAVQAMSIVALAASAAFGVLSGRVVVSPQAKVAIVAAMTGAAGFITVIATHRGEDARADLDQQLTLVLTILAALALGGAALAYLNRNSLERSRHMAGVIAGSMAFGGITAVFKVLVELVLREGLDTVATAPSTLIAVLALVAGGVVGAVHLQRAHQVLPAPTVVASLTITDTLTVAVIGTFVLGETALSPSSAVLLLGFGCLAIAGVIGSRGLRRHSEGPSSPSVLEPLTEKL